MKQKNKILGCLVALMIMFSTFNVVFAEDHSEITILHPDAGNIDVRVVFQNGFSRSYDYSGFNDSTVAANFQISLTVDGQGRVMRAFCSDHNAALPMNSPWDKVVERAKIMSPGEEGYNMKLAMAVYYGFGGPGDVTAGAGTDDQRVALTAYACNYANKGTGDSEGLARASAQYAALKSHIDNCDGPQNIQYIFCNAYAYKWEYINDKWVNCAPDTNGTPLGGTCQDYQALSAFWGYAPQGDLEVTKSLDANAPYATVENAEFGVYSDEACTKLVGTVKTDARGNSNKLTLNAGTYWVKETRASEGTLLNNSKYVASIASGNTTTVTVQNTVAFKLKMHKILNPINGKYGHAVTTNAEYSIYSDSSCNNYVTKVVVSPNGNSSVTENLPYKTYYAKETKAPEGTFINNEIITLDPSKAVKEGNDYVATYDATNDIINTKLKVVKMHNEADSTTENPAVGAVLKLQLKNGTESYTAVTDSLGECTFDDVPYGTYILSEEVQDSLDYKKIDPQEIYLEKAKSEHEYQVLVGEKRYDAFVKLVKKDQDTKKVVKLSGTKFKIFSVEENKMVEQIEPLTGKTIDVFETNDEGYLVTPRKLLSGEYRIYEVNAPEGYYLEDSLREDGLTITINTNTVVELDENGEYVYIVSMFDRPLKAKIEVLKTAETLTDATIKTTEFGELVTPIYEQKGLKDVKYDVYAAEDIMSRDGTTKLVQKDEKVDTIITNEDGVATTKELNLGKYYLKEVSAPAGILINEEKVEVTLENNDQYTRVETKHVALNNQRQKLALKITKEFEDANYAITKDVKKVAIFGVFAAEDINNYNGTKVISKDDLMFVMEYKDGDVSNEGMDLPSSTYYVKEIKTEFPYVPSETVHTVKLTGDTTNNVIVEKYAGNFVNIPEETATVTLIKLSTSIIKDVVYNGATLDDEKLDDEVETIISELKAMSEDEIEAYLKENEIKFVAGATYGLFLDEKCEEPLYMLSENGEYVEAQIITSETGMIKLSNIPIGKYYVKETSAPRGYELSKDILTIDLAKTDKNAVIYQALMESPIISHAITKMDIFSSQYIEDCVFEILDENKEVLLHSVTDGNGRGFIPTDIFEDGKTYYYKEISAPDMYVLNEEEHPFVAKLDKDGNWIGEKIKVENIRKEATVTLIKTDVMDSTLIPNCKFELRSLENEEWVVEGVTDENGVYVFENVPYGVYTYTELEAPEEYKIDTTPHEFTVNKDKVILEVTNELNTGDIAVFALAGIALVSVLGIAVTLRKKALNK